MKDLIGIFLLCMLSVVALGQTAGSQIAIIPEPVSVTKTEGVFTLPQRVTVAVGNQPELKQVVAFVKERFSVPTGNEVVIQNAGAGGVINFVLNGSADNQIGKEGYRLSVKPQQVTVTANTPAGLYYGAQSLVQLYPKDIESRKKVENVAWL